MTEGRRAPNYPHAAIGWRSLTLVSEYGSEELTICQYTNEVIIIISTIVIIIMVKSINLKGHTSSETTHRMILF